MGRSRSGSRSPRRRYRSRSRSTERRRDDSRERHRGDCSNDRRPLGSVSSRSKEQDAEAEKKAARLAKLRAWKEQQHGGAPAPSFPAPCPAPPPQPESAPPPAEEVDPLDAFMASEVLPEVAAREAEERARAEEERANLQELLKKGRLPKALQDLIEDDKEETPDDIIEVPSNKVKLVVGPGGEKIKWIQKKSKCRIQHAIEDEDLQRGFGTGPALPAALKRATDPSAPPKMTKLLLYGNSEAVEAARALIQEAIDNREQKAKQRQREYDKKREEKKLQRQIYHMRHALDYEALELPLGASKAEIKAAYRKLALKWHPDKNMDRREEAEKKFQELSKAYESLMSTDEDTTVQQLAHA